MSGPLDGIRVIEIGTLIAAPFAARMLAEFGAEVIKIETPNGGDPLRKWRKLHEGTSLWWYLQSRNKKSVCVNLKSADGIDIVKRLAAEADVVIENLRPGALEKLGIGWDVLHAINPKLTMVRISGYGQSGPYRDRPGFGAIGEAMGGIRYTRPATRTACRRARRRESRRFAGIVAWRDRRADVGAAREDRQGRRPGRGRVARRERLQPDGEPGARIRPARSRAPERSGGALPGIAPSNTYRTEDGLS